MESVSFSTGKRTNGEIGGVVYDVVLRVAYPDGGGEDGVVAGLYETNAVLRDKHYRQIGVGQDEFGNRIPEVEEGVGKEVLRVELVGESILAGIGRVGVCNVGERWADCAVVICERLTGTVVEGRDIRRLHERSTDRLFLYLHALFGRRVDAQIIVRI